ncbi:helix-turn-helix transcriptional regulator [Neobacillus niacini]|uniref:helix-turn-helix transcriptional regulator n=1 Tax=Neobacillus niacini TaxID=86668 RepID=UPI00398329EC
MSILVNHLSEPRKRIIERLKNKGSQAISELAGSLDISGEAVRQHLVQLEKEGWVTRFSENKGVGRPLWQYRLTTAGEHLFKKNYDQLMIEVFDTLSLLGEDLLKNLLAAMIEERIRQWEPKLTGLTTSERLDVLKDFYKKDDSFMELENNQNSYALIERNCPFHNVAIERPILCSVSVSVLTHLLGCSVKREKRLQNGDGCCAFRILLNEPITEDTSRIIMEDINPTN